VDWKESSWALGNRGLALSLTSLSASCIFPDSRGFHTHIELDNEAVSTDHLERVRSKGAHVKCLAQHLTHGGY